MDETGKGKSSCYKATKEFRDRMNEEGGQLEWTAWRLISNDFPAGFQLETDWKTFHSIQFPKGLEIGKWILDLAQTEIHKYYLQLKLTWCNAW